MPQSRFTTHVLLAILVASLIPTFTFPSAQGGWNLVTTSTCLGTSHPSNVDDIDGSVDLMWKYKSSPEAEWGYLTLHWPNSNADTSLGEAWLAVLTHLFSVASPGERD